MKVLRVEFAPRRSVPSWLWGSVAIGLLLLAGHQAWLAWALYQRVLIAERESAALSAELGRVLQDRRDAMALARVEAPYARDAAVIAGLASFPLAQVLSSLEAVRVPGVKVTVLDISAIERSAKAELEFADYAALNRYLDELNAGEPKIRWRLIQLQSGSTGGAGSTASIGSSWTADNR